MITAAALEWLDVTFDARRCEAFDHAFRNRGPMITLKSDMDAGEPMHVRPGDYHDPLRWWL
jgi:hypothetical protein